ncbi:MAG TPA: prolyl oligopeptidase family serine peptidase [Paraburkholderia sp.]|nr:prolyl oligopeptidase family serine peptidase [Paraburkholderia sp.]
MTLDDAWLPASGINETIVRVPVDAAGSIALETTIYKPDGAGPFPMIVFNHGKMRGDPGTQARSDPVSFAREFVRRGYVVAAPNREGFGRSGGTYQQDGCDVERNGIDQARDVAATIDYLSQQPYVDATRILVAGTSHGGLVTMAYGSEAAPGVRALINFSGGLRQDACADWQGTLTRAFGTYGEQASVPSLWLYGDNDSIWTGPLVARMYAAYTAHGASARMVDFGSYKNDAHRLVGDRDGVEVWWPAVEAFLARIGMPTGVRYRVADPKPPQPSGYAALDAVDAVPFVDQVGRNAYRDFLHQYPSRAFAVSDSGGWAWAEGGDDPMAVALARCQDQSAGPCRLYAVNDAVVWRDRSKAVAKDRVDGAPDLVDRGAETTLFVSRQ